MMVRLTTNALAGETKVAPMKHAVAYLVFEVAPEHRELFITLDDQI